MSGCGGLATERYHALLLAQNDFFWGLFFCYSFLLFTSLLSPPRGMWVEIDGGPRGRPDNQSGCLNYNGILALVIEHCRVAADDFDDPGRTTPSTVMLWNARPVEADDLT